VSFTWRGRVTPTIVGMTLLIAFPHFLRAQDDPRRVIETELIPRVGWEERCEDVDHNTCSELRIYIKGAIKTDTAAQFEKALARWDQKEHLFVNLNSPGGDIAAMLKIGRMIRKSGGHTIVEGQATCASACVLLFGAGLSRVVFEGGKIGIHRPALAAVPRESDMAAVQAAADRAARELREYAAEMNIGGRLIDDMLVVQPENVRWLSVEDLRGYGLGFLDPVYEETAVLDGAKKYNITPGEYRRRNALARSVCNTFVTDEFYGILEGKRSQCAEDTLATGKPDDWVRPGEIMCKNGAQACKPWE
jgi:ATP-dependent protease ClpP protease subunit